MEHWEKAALCAQVDPELWFPERGHSTLHAKQICGRCPVQAECLEDALAGSYPYGIRGGKSEHERRKIRKDRAAQTGYLSLNPSNRVSY
jgi:WhiB family redox-sensing transcriptional regulator